MVYNLKRAIQKMEEEFYNLQVHVIVLLNQFNKEMKLR